MNYCQCKEPEIDTDDRGQRFCLNCLLPIEIPEPDLDRDYEAKVEEELENYFENL